MPAALQIRVFWKCFQVLVAQSIPSVKFTWASIFDRDLLAGTLGLMREPGISGIAGLGSWDVGSLVSLGSWALAAWQPWGCRAGCRNKGFLNYYLISLSRSYCLLYILLIYFKVPVYVIMNYLIGASSPSSLSLHWALTGAHCIFLKYSPKFLSKLKAKWKLQKREWETKLKCFLHFVGTKIWCCSDQ